MKKHKVYKQHVYKQDLNIPCPEAGCDKHFKTVQAFHGHLRMVHGIQEKVIPSLNPGDPGVKNDSVISSDTIESLKGENELLKLQIKNRQLTAQFPSGTNGQQDIMAQAGLGNIEGEAKLLAQKRALGIMDQGHTPSWLDKLLANPAALETAINGLKGILGVNSGNGSNGDQMATLLSTLGFSLKDLILNATAPKSGALEIAGVSLAGTSLTPELLKGILEYKAAETKAQAELQGRQEMANALKSAFEGIGGMIKNGQLRMPGNSISQEIIPEPEIRENVIICDSCGTENPLPADLVPGQTVKCQGENCPRSWMVQAPPAAQKQRAKKQVKVEPPIVEETTCPGCGQLVNLDGRSIGESVVCPVCQVEYVVKSEDLAVRAEDPLSESEKQRQAFLHR